MRLSASPMILLFLGAAACTGDLATEPSDAAGPSLARSAVFPPEVALPNGFGADGLGFGKGTTLYVGSYSSGAIWRADARTGTGGLLVPPQPGRSACALAYDPRFKRLFVAGSLTGQAYVYDAETGATLASYQLGDPSAGPTGVLDVAVTRDAVYFTDAARPVLYRLPLGAGGALPAQGAVQVLSYSGDYEFVAGSTLNSIGMVKTPNERWLIVANATTGLLYRVDPATAQTRVIDLGGAALLASDGMALVGHTLYVDQVFLNRVAVVQLNDDFSSGVVQLSALGSALLDSPSKIAVFGDAIYAANARFETPPTSDVPYQVVRLAR